ncbi:MAG: type II toxin-antitoxin system VapC family toxin [Defluviitaleaceae bacterium]|nr:type II toxin-antitoxin system VapC family toxin [Defluviitaleaceae bacterium]
MRYLLDTCAIIWYFDEEETKLPSDIRSMVNSPESEIFVSIVSIWEIVIKIGKGRLDVNFDILFSKLFRAQFEILPIGIASLQVLRKLNLEIHKDPFDRMIIATAMAKDLTIVTSDKDIQKYNIQTIW